MNFELTKFKGEYFKGLTLFLGDLWKLTHKIERESKINWRYLSNTKYPNPFVFLALDHDKIIGVRAFVIQEFLLGGKLITIFSPADTLVDQTYRKKGVLRKLNHELISNIEHERKLQPSFILNLSSNRLSTPANLNLGWRKTNSIKKYAYRFSPLQWLNRLIKKKSFENSFQYTREERNFSYEISGQIKIKEILTLITKTHNSKKITNNRTADYYRWRYSEPGKIFHFGYAWQSGELKAVVFFQIVSSNQAIILEYHAVSSGLLKKCISLFQKQAKIPVIRTIVLTNHQKKILTSCGLISEPDWLLNILKIKRLPVLVRPTKSNFSEEDFFIYGKDLRDIENWLLFQADVH